MKHIQMKDQHIDPDPKIKGSRIAKTLACAVRERFEFVGIINYTPSFNTKNVPLKTIRGRR